MKDKPITTLFMLMSVDGKISTGSTDVMDVDADFPKLKGVSEGLHQYYEIERTTDLWSLNSGRVQAKIGVNTDPMPEKCPVSFVVIDNKHLDKRGVEYFCALSKRIVIVTTNKVHPAYDVHEENLSVLYQDRLDVDEMLQHLHREYQCERITIQTGGTLNALFLREKLIDQVDIVVAPILVGGRETSTLIDGSSLTSPAELDKLGVLRLEVCDVLKDSYIRLRYRVIR